MGYLTTYFVVGQPYGSLSDLSVAIDVMLLAPLAVFIYVLTYQAQPVVAMGGRRRHHVSSRGVVLDHGRKDQLRAVPAAGDGRVRSHRPMAHDRLFPAAPTGGDPAKFGQCRSAGGRWIGIYRPRLPLEGVNASYQSGVIWSNSSIYLVPIVVAVGFIGLPVWAVLVGR